MAEEIPRNMDAKLSNAIDVCAAKLQATYLAPEAETTNAMNAMVDAMLMLYG
jgi:hypothetical protein